jgi:TolB-like protein
MSRRSFSPIAGLCMALLVCAASPAVAGATDNRIAVMDFETQDLPRSTGAMAAELVRTELANEKSFTVIERNRINLILKEHGFQQSGCTDQSCAVEVGRLLSANKILTGTVMKLGGQIIITVRLVDVQSGKIDCGEKETSASVEGLSPATERLARRIALCGGGKINTPEDRAGGKNEEVLEVDTRSPYYRSPSMAAVIALIPCWSGSFYPYDFNTDRYPGFGILMSIGKTGTFATGLGAGLAAFYNTPLPSESSEKYDKSINIMLYAFAAWGGLTLIDAIYSAAHVNNYNKKYAGPGRGTAGDFSIMITPRLAMSSHDTGTPAVDGANAAILIRW